MPEFVSKPKVKDGIVPSDPRDLTTKEYVDGRNLEDLANVDLAGVAQGDLVTFDGEDWLPTSDPLVNSVIFDTSTVTEPELEGQLVWDNDVDTLSFVLKGGDTVLQIGQETLFHVKNQTGLQINKGTAVGFAGTVGNSGRLLVKPFIANSSEPSQYFVGLATENIADGDDGYVTHFGKLKGLDTSSFDEGDILYVSSENAGGLTKTAPIAPNNIIQVGAVITSDDTNGTLIVRATIGSNINDDEGVRIEDPSGGDILLYDSNIGVFINSNTIDGGSPSSTF
jgi:hypothetical protein